MELIYTVRSSFHLTYTSNTDYEIIQQQWMSLLAAQNPVSHAERVCKILHFGCNLRLNLGQNDTI